MANVKLTEENKESLAQEIVNGMDIDDLMESWKDHLIEMYDEDAEKFQEDWKNIME